MSVEAKLLDDKANFYCKSDEAHIIKTLSEVLQNILTDVCFEFTKDGIKLLTIDGKTPTQLMVNLNLNRDKFGVYVSKKNMAVGINLQHLYKMLKSVKKKDHISLIIPSDKMNVLCISTSQTVNGPPVKSDIKIQKLQKLDVSIPSGYSHPNIIPTANFQKLCKDMNSISKTIKIYSKGSYICFSCEVEGLYNREVPFGDLDPSSKEVEYEDYFNTKTLAQLIKISGLNGKMRIYTLPGSPLKISIDTGSLGLLDIYIKSKEQLESD